MIRTIQKTAATQLILGPTGKLEVWMQEPHGESHKGWGIICHPHPLFGGTMHNKVVSTLAKTFEGLGLNTVRFNFRGVGQSEGTFNEGIGEIQDLLAVVEWLAKIRTLGDLYLGGFSFGAYIAARATPMLNVHTLVTIAPPVEHFPMQAVPPILCPWLLVQGERDEVVPADQVFAFAEGREPKPTLLRFPEAGHFFHGQLQELRLRMLEVLG